MENIDWLKKTLEKTKKEHCNKRRCSNCKKRFTQGNGEPNCFVAITEVKIFKFENNII